MAASWNHNRLAAMLGIDYPIIQGPFGGLSSQRLTAAVSNFGLGSFGALSLKPDTIRDAIAEIRSLTAKPFAVNLWVSMEDEGAGTSDESGFNRSLAPLAAHLAAWRDRGPRAWRRGRADRHRVSGVRRIRRERNAGSSNRLSIAAEAAGRSDLLPMWVGQSANLGACTDVSAFLSALVKDVGISRVP